MKDVEKNPLHGNKRYTKIADLNSGSFGFVVKALNNATKKVVAIKFLLRGDHIQQYVEREILNHKTLRHPHVVQFYEVFLTKDYLAIVMEYADQGDLFRMVQKRVRLPDSVARPIFQQLIFGLEYCHRRGVVNRDVKLENVLLQSGLRVPLVKLCDFGYSKHEEWNSAPSSRVGTPDYMAPEIVKTREGPYDAKMSDIWSCGVVLYVMVVGQYPFSRNEDSQLPDQQSQFEVMQRIMKIDFKVPGYVSSGCRDLISKIMQEDPNDRLTIRGIMKHPWYREGLPPDALTMNDVYLKASQKSGLQSDAEISKIVREATIGRTKPQALLSDEYADEALDEEMINMGAKSF
ncbi:hypothetical protein BSKO_08349 [Bryopsis sp. KO-2023]|nr:hypothetical protein BSKO_08349 [Bryopsis sp. KO-2023]